MIYNKLSYSKIDFWNFNQYISRSYNKWIISMLQIVYMTYHDYILLISSCFNLVEREFI